jgi:hypothetical protein
LMWTEGHRGLFIRKIRDWPKRFQELSPHHNTREQNYESTTAQQRAKSTCVNSRFIALDPLQVIPHHWPQSLAEVPLCPGTVWALIVVLAEGTTQKPWWYPSGAHSEGQQNPRAVSVGNPPSRFQRMAI